MYTLPCFSRPCMDRVGWVDIHHGSHFSDSWLFGSFTFSKLERLDPQYIAGVSSSRNGCDA